MATITCGSVDLEKIRAEVLIGGDVIARTPFVKSFSVNKSRTQLSNTFNVTLQVLAGISFTPGEKLSIRAGLRGNLKTIFTGIIKSTQVQPTFGLPGYFSITLSGRGVLSALENKKFSRRLKVDGQGLYVLITGGSANRPTKGFSPDQPARGGNRQTISKSPDPAQQTGEHSVFIRNRSSGKSPITGNIAIDIAGKTEGGAGGALGGTGGEAIHDHSTLEQGGPSFAVYSAD